uniref:RNA-directed DNA polymerase n=1 Tax=Tanacetum cinerariifolium TaxID=118510 RepID=A0A6L2JSN1_TANCI|nr:DNA-directed DNA polymerase [Tanacetum cinerariifolium]
MDELLQAPTEGYGEAIVIPEINADHFEIKMNLLQLYYKEPPNSILTWEDLVNKFVNQFFPPSKTTHLKNEISQFTQRSEETFGEAWEQFKKMLRACPCHRFIELTQINTLYSGLNKNDQDSLNAAAGGNLLSKTTREALHIIKNKSKVRYSRNKPNVSWMNTASRENVSKTDDRIDKLADQISTLVDIFSKKVVTPTTVKAVEESCVTCGGNHAYYNCDATNRNQSSVYAATSTYNQVAPQNRASNFMAPPGFAPVQNNNQNRFNQNQGQGNNFNRGNNFHGNQSFQVPNQGFQNQPFQVPNNQVQQGGFIQNQTSTSGTLPSNTIPNTKGEMKAITTRSGVAYEGPSIPTLKKVVERENEETTDKEQTNFQGNVLLLMLKFASTIKSLLANKDKLFELAKIPLNENSSAMLLKKHPKKLGDPGKFLVPSDFPGMDVCHALADLGAIINLMLFSIWKKLSLPELTPTRMTLELADRSITHPKGVAKDIFVQVGKFHFPTDFVVVDFEADPRVPLILGRSFLRTGRALIDVYGEEITLRVNDKAVTFNLNQTTRYSSTYDDMSVNRIDIIDVAREEYAQEMLGFSNNFSGGNPTSSSKPIIFDSSPSLTPFEGKGDICLIEKLLNDDPFQLPLIDLKQGEVIKAKSSIEEPPDLELKDLPSYLEYAYLEGVDKLPAIIAKDLKVDEKEALLKAIKKEVIKLLDAGMIYPISDSSWVIPIHCVPKKGGITIVENENNELIPVRLVTRWRVCIDYRNLNDATRKDHFPLPFMVQMLERLAGNEFYCFLDGFSGYFQILISPPNQEKTTFTCPYGTFAYRRMSFGLCNAPRTFQRCMMAIFHDMIEKTMEVFMDDFSIFGDSFSSCLSYLDPMLQRCEDTNLSLNWEKCHFMVKEGIFLGHTIFKIGLEVDRAKVDVIAKLPHPTTVKECIDAFETLKKKLTQAPILVVPDWNLPFELMCDASDFAIGAVLGQRKMKHFHHIHYASKTMTEAQIHYTTMEKEMLAVVYAFEKFWPYLVLSKSIVYTDHPTLKYLLSKQDAKPRLLRWVFLLQEFDIIIRDKKGTENLMADHLSRLENPHKDVFENKDKNENFPLETLGKISCGSTPLFSDVANFHAGNLIVNGMSSQQKKKFFKDVKHYSWDDPYLFEFVRIKSFDDFMGPFSSSRGNRYILVTVYYLSKWVEAKALPTNDASDVVKFLKYLFARFETPRAIISDRGTHFCNDKFAKVMSKYGVTHRLATAYHSQTNGQVEKLQLNKLNELHDQAYENSFIYKEKTKKLHGSKIKNRIFNVGDRVLLFNSRLKIFSGKLKTRWSGPFTITKVFPYGTIELSQPEGLNFKVNGHRVKHYFGGDVPQLVLPDLQTFPMDK